MIIVINDNSNHEHFENDPKHALDDFLETNYYVTYTFQTMNCYEVIFLRVTYLYLCYSL